MTKDGSVAAIREQLFAIMQRLFGAAAERPFEAGVIDSLKSIDFGFEIESTLGVPIARFETQDFDSVTSLATKIARLQAEEGESS